MDNKLSSTKGLPSPYWDTAASVRFPAMWLSLGTLQVSRAQERGKSLPEGGTQEDSVAHLQLLLGLCIHAPVMASPDHGGSPQNRNCEFPGLAAPEQPSLAEISACVYMSCLCLAPTAGNL